MSPTATETEFCQQPGIAKEDPAPDGNIALLMPLFQTLSRGHSHTVLGLLPLSEIKNGCCFKPPNVWYFVTLQVKTHVRLRHRIAADSLQEKVLFTRSPPNMHSASSFSFPDIHRTSANYPQPSGSVQSLEHSAFGSITQLSMNSSIPQEFSGPGAGDTEMNKSGLLPSQTS